MVMSRLVRVKNICNAVALRFPLPALFKAYSSVSLAPTHNVVHLAILYCRVYRDCHYVSHISVSNFELSNNLKILNLASIPDSEFFSNIPSSLPYNRANPSGIGAGEP